MRVAFGLVVWGDGYTDDFLRYSLPTLLGEGNIPALPSLSECRLQIFTRAEDFGRFRSNALFRRLERLVPTVFVEIGEVQGKNKYRFASSCQAEFLRRSEDFDAVVFLYPDMIWPRGGVTFAVESLGAHALGVFVPAPAVGPEGAAALLASPENVVETPDGSVVSLAALDVAGLALRHHHRMWKAFDWDGGCFADYPSCLRWNVTGQGWLLRCFHLHPLILRVQRDNPAFFQTFVSLDAEYVARLFSSTENLVFATDTESFAMVTLRDKDQPPFPRSGIAASVPAVAQWAEGSAYLLHRAFAGVSFRWHDAPVDSSLWVPVEQRAQAIVGEIRDRLATPDSVIRAEDPAAYRARIRRSQTERRRRTEITLPPSRASLSRLGLAGALARRVVLGNAWHLVSWLRTTRTAQWLQGQPRAVALYRKMEKRIRPRSELDYSVSPSSLAGSLLRRRRAK